MVNAKKDTFNFNCSFCELKREKRGQNYTQACVNELSNANESNEINSSQLAINLSIEYWRQNEKKKLREADHRLWSVVNDSVHFDRFLVFFFFLLSFSLRREPFYGLFVTENNFFTSFEVWKSEAPSQNLPPKVPTFQGSQAPGLENLHFEAAFELTSLSQTTFTTPKSVFHLVGHLDHNLLWGT